jgi:hypothetical protein
MPRLLVPGSWLARTSQEKRGCERNRGLAAAARSRRGVGPRTGRARKSFDEHRAVEGVDTHTNNPTVMATNSIKLLTGNSYPQLARLVADRYVHAVGATPGALARMQTSTTSIARLA